MARILMIVAQKGFKDEELLIPKEILEKDGHEIKIASLARAKAEGVGGTIVQPDMAVHEANPDFFDCIVLVGGPGSPVLAQKEEVLNLAKNANSLGKIVAAICLAPTALANAGVLKGKKATVFPDENAILTLRKMDAKYVEEPIVIDGNIITADCPASAGEFGNAIAQMLKEKNL